MQQGGRIGVFGGSFDPVHTGHLMLAENARVQAHLARVLFMPTHIQPFKQGKEVSPDDDRLRMLQFALRDNPYFGVSTVEIDRGGVSYTIDSLRMLKEDFQFRTVFILGTDMFLMIEKWHKADELLREFDLAVGVRPGYRHDEAIALAGKLRAAYGTRIDLIDNPPIELSSTELREALRPYATGAPGAEASRGEAKYSLRYLVPEDVRRFLFVRAKEGESRFAHTKRVMDLAAYMATLFGEDPHRAQIAALLHDYCKLDGGGEAAMLENNLAHGPMAAEAARSEFGVTDEDVLSAIRWHTTGRAGMSRLELIIFLADTVEPGRTYDGADRLRALCLEDLEKGGYTVLVELREYLLKKGYTVTSSTEEAIVDLKARIA
ncbi:MAG: nicotinate-nucleotide adenylyltransferase [Clostridiales Family XIII bacterium]|jgi:nicotinate-nucleotide adenylyltransferase|nr:nicotinate-nucleotide adenylyltransferase [Clostridiales Family XIII bacterium]